MPVARPAATTRCKTQQYNCRFTETMAAELNRRALERSVKGADVVRALVAAWLRDPTILKMGFGVEESRTF
jgi:hypothetical protein